MSGQVRSDATTLFYLQLASACSASSTTTTLTADPWDATNATYYAAPEWSYVPVPPALPPNYARPKTLCRRQDDRAPCIALAQVGFWINSMGRRAAA